MDLSHIIQRLRETKVLENYSFMTVLSIVSALIGLVIYPFVIRATGKDAYGTYVYAFTIASFFQVIMDFGFDSPCAKAIVHARNDSNELSRIVSTTLALKLGFIILCSLVFTICLYVVPFMRHNIALCVITFVQLVAMSMFPTWYFQGLKKMKTVTYINLTLRLLTIPLIIWLIRSPQDIMSYALIVMISIVAGTLVAYICLLADGIRWQRVSAIEAKQLIRDATPFFATSLTGSLKSLSIKAIIKHFFGIGDVAIYDLAEKIITIPRFFTQNINSALFPEVIANAIPSRVQRILKYERIIGASFAVIIALLSYPAVILLGGQQMLGAIPITILLSGTIYTYLVVGAYLNFLFIPANRYYAITLNQIVALISCVSLACLGLLVWKDITMVALGLALSGFIEILFCRYYATSYLHMRTGL